MNESVLKRAIANRLNCESSQFNPRNMRKDEFRALQLAGLVGQSGWYLSGAECWRFDRRAGKRLLALAAATRRAKTPKAVECEASQSGDAKQRNAQPLGHRPIRRENNG